MDAYFAGTAPFRQAKRREDFPDAFVWQTILDLAEVHNPLYVVSADKGVLAAAREIKNAVVHESLENFVASEPFQTVLRRHFASTNFKAILELLPGHLEGVASVFANELVDALVGQTVRSRNIPGETSEAMISGVGNPTDLVLNLNAAVDHGDGLVVIPFSLQTECLLDYAIFKADFYTLPEEKSDRISTSELNRHYYSAEEEYALRVEGRLSVEVDADSLKESDLSKDDLLSILDDGEIKIDAIELIEVV